MNRIATIVGRIGVGCLAGAAVLSLAVPAEALSPGAVAGGALSVGSLERVGAARVVSQKYPRAGAEIDINAIVASIVALNAMIGGADVIAVYADSGHCLAEYFSIDARPLASSRRFEFMVSYSGDVATDHIPGVLSPNGVITQTVGDLLATKLVAWGAGGSATISIRDNGVEIASRRVPVFVNSAANTSRASDAVRRMLACDPRLVARVN